MTDFLSKELGRLLSTLPKTDPTTREYLQLLQNIEVLGGTADTLNEYIMETGVDVDRSRMCEPAAAVDTSVPPEEMTQPDREPESDYAIPDEKPDNVIPFNAPDFPETPAKEPAKAYSREEVRAALASARKEKGIKVSTFLKEHFGVDNFPALPGEKYAEVVALLEAL